MAISIPAAPTQSVDALRAGLPSMAKLGALTRFAPHLAASLTGKKTASVTPAFSYPVYTLGLTDLATAAECLKTAKPSLWRHTLTFDGEVVTADTSADPSGAKLTSLRINPNASAVQTTIRALGKDAATAKASYEASLLQVPALGVRAVWLRDPSGKSPDIFVPVAPVRSELAAGRQYTLAEFVAALKGPAAKILANDDPRKGS